jgi:ParB family chromosome partitioning protein
VQESLAGGVLSEGHGRALLGLPDKGSQLRLARRVVEKGMSVRQVEDEVRRWGEGGRSSSTRQSAALDKELVDEIRDALLSLLGVTPRVRSKGMGGVVELPFEDGDELRRLAERLRL